MESESANREATAFALKPPSFWSPWLLGLIGGTVGGSTLWMWIARDTFDVLSWPSLLVNGTVLASLIGVIVIRALTLPKTVPPICFEADAVVLPRRVDSRRLMRVAYPDILSVTVWGNRRALLVVGTRQRLFVYPFTSFVDPGTPDQFRMRLQQALLALPQGQHLWSALVAREDIAHHALARKSVWTWTLLGLLGVIFGLEMALEVTARPLLLVDLGANAPVLVREGQWFRLVSANFLHVHWLHLYINGLALYVLGALLERLLGGQRFLIVYLLSALGGALASMIVAQSAFSVGSSTAVFGLLGALALLNWRYAHELPGGFRQPTRWWLGIVGLNTLLPFLVPQIDIAAHLGGFMVGAGVTWALVASQVSFDPLAPVTRRVSAVAVISALVFLMGLGQAGVRAFNPPEQDQLSVARAYAQMPSADTRILNQIAWTFATEVSPSLDKLHTAQQLATQAVSRNDTIGYHLGTLATTHYRLGNFDEAVTAARRGLHYRQNRVMATQLMRFLKARIAHSGPMFLGEAAVDDVHLQLEPRPTDEKAGRGIQVQLGRIFQRGAVIYAHVRDGQREMGLFRVILSAGHRSEIRLTDPKHPQMDYFPNAVTFEVALIDAQGHATERVVWRYWRSDPEILSLP